MFIQTVSSREHGDFHIGFQEGLHALQFTKTAVALHVLRLGSHCTKIWQFQPKGNFPLKKHRDERCFSPDSIFPVVDNAHFFSQ
ncbi:hypothetical protein SBC1_62120 (plasmid) [Caballeronia sp. SBC1]|nr:hypothetical protein SBC2_61790 [Caballeronia sp. SBC2]QIN66165.1 hypothetical protein SBC1_62120 [Caballeronia sp. SBC1]